MEGRKMNIYLVSRTDDIGYDEYDSIVIAAKTAQEACSVHPGGDAWQKPEDLKVELIGKAIKGSKQGIVLASFNAG
jgi:hypothetical protein